jgi:hypothetical protein
VAFADFDAYIAALRLNVAADFQQAAVAGFTAARLGDLSRTFVPTPAVPTTSVALDSGSDRAINGAVPNAGAGRLSILAGRINPGGASGVALMLVDILNISGGLNASLTTAQTTNLPTAALTRYTSGEGVHAALMVHATVGGTATTVTCSYTNQSGTSGQTTTATTFGGSGLTAAGTLVRLPLQAGDTGVQSVESVTLAGTTGTAGNFGVVLYKPLAFIFANDVEGANITDNVSTGRMVGQFNEVLDDACLSCFAVMAVAQTVSGAILLGEA